ncbi:hypothetical protein PVL29_024873 [Vitis rotundifolia]|uniref:Uncharacterized protein n=1 Tax=Vitis rotundifolia TaxID=103349 RepID=A0AA39D8S9_VITRO|nr:hypothetical protein PVL29_024873 [Vitis rotundifolia]
MPLPETVGPVARNKWELVMVPFQLANGGLVRGCLLVQFPQLMCGALLMGKGLKNSPLIHCAGNIMHPHPHRHLQWTLRLLMVCACELCFVAAPMPAQCIINRIREATNWD